MLSHNNSFKPKPLRSGKNMAEKACHVFTSTTRFGLTQALGLMINDSDIARNAIFEILDNQLTAGDPPEAREALDRLLADGHSEHEARRLIACVVASEVFAVVQEGRDFDRSRYIKALRALPKLPWD